MASLGSNESGAWPRLCLPMVPASCSELLARAPVLVEGPGKDCKAMAARGRKDLELGLVISHEQVKHLFLLGWQLAARQATSNTTRTPVVWALTADIMRLE